MKVAFITVYCAAILVVSILALYPFNACGHCVCCCIFNNWGNFFLLLWLQVASGAHIETVDDNESGWTVSDFVSPLGYFTKISALFKAYLGDIDCVRNVISDVMEDSNMKMEWRKVQRDFDYSSSIQWKRCLELEDKKKRVELVSGKCFFFAI